MGEKAEIISEPYLSISEDYYNDPDAEEDKVKEEKFVPKPYNGKSTPKKSVTSEKTAAEKKVTAQQGVSQKPVSMTNADSGQMTMGDFGPVKESA